MAASELMSYACRYAATVALEDWQVVLCAARRCCCREVMMIRDVGTLTEGNGWRDAGGHMRCQMALARWRVDISDRGAYMLVIYAR